MLCIVAMSLPHRPYATADIFLLLMLQGARSEPAPAPAPSGGNGASSAAQVTPIILTTSSGLQAHILPIGATIQRLIVPNQDGIAEDVVLGYDDPKIYQVPLRQASFDLEQTSARHTPFYDLEV